MKLYHLVSAALIAAIWGGLFLSFSQSSFVALGVGILVAAAAALGRRTAVAALVAVVLAVSLAFFGYVGAREIGQLLSR